MSWEGKSVLVTGGTGSFGKKFIRHVLAEKKPRRLIVFSRDELKQHEMRVGGFDHPSLRYFIGDVRDSNRLHRAMQDVDLVVHAAALKQVPACEYNPIEAIRTNIDGAVNIVDAAINAGVKQVLALSTDKAVNPVNLYGATKLCSEKLFVQGNAYAGGAGTRFSCVRYGNVVGSRGSVVPLFLEQRKTGRLTITDPRMTRFWITLDQGVQFVVNCIDRMVGGEVFVPKIPSMKMIDLATSLAPECQIDVIGIRPGEKLHEMLLSEDEARHSLELNELFVVQPTHPWWNADQIKVGKPLPEGFSYTSDNNPRWLTDQELQTLLSQLS